MEPTKKKYYPTTTTQPANSITSSTLNKIKAHNPKSVPNFNKPASNPPLVHTHLPPTFSTLPINVSSNSSLSNKTHHHHPKPIKQDTLSMEKQRKNKEKEKITEPIPRGSGGLSSEASVGVGGRRESFCYSHIKLGDFFTSLGVRILSGDMPPFMQRHAVSTARNAYDGLDKFSSRTLASTLKKEFDAVYGAAWHCIVGTSFGSFVTHSVGGFLYFSMDPKLYILLFKTTVIQISN